MSNPMKIIVHKAAPLKMPKTPYGIKPPRPNWFIVISASSENDIFQFSPFAENVNIVITLLT